MIPGSAGPDRIAGRDGDDTIEGFAGDDRLWAQAQRDRELPGVGTLRGEEGDDRIRTPDGEPDVGNCGPGHDVARVDLSDVIEDATASDPKGSCEHVRRRASGPRDGRG